MAGLLRADLSEADFLTLAGCYSDSTVSRVGEVEGGLQTASKKNRGWMLRV